LRYSHDTLCAANRGGLFCGETRISSVGLKDREGLKDHRSGFGDSVKNKPMEDARKQRCYSGQSRKSRRKLTPGGKPSPTVYRQIRKERQTDKFRLALCAIGTLRTPCRCGIPQGSLI